MMQFFADRFDAGVEIAIRSVAILILAAVVTALLRRSAAAARHLVWTAALTGVLTLPVLPIILPFEVTIPVIFARQPVPQSALQSASQPAPQPASATSPLPTVGMPLVAVATATEQSADSRLTPEPVDVRKPPAIFPDPGQVRPALAPAPPISWAEITVIVWLVGATACSLPWLLGCLSLWWLFETRQPLPANVAKVLKSLTVGMRRVVGIQSAHRGIPMTWGIWRSVILLPVEAAQWPVERLRVVLLHELAHVRRRDCLTQVLGQIVRSLYWFNPLAWWALSRLRFEQEQACDDSVLNSGAVAEDYAAELLSVTARLPRASWDSAVALAMGRAARLEKRLNAILDIHRNRRTPSATRIVAGLALLTGFIVTLAIVRPREIQAQDAVISQQPAVSQPAAPPPTPASPAKQRQATQKEPVQVEPVQKVETAPATAPAKELTAAELQEVIALIEKHSANPTNSMALNEAAIRGMMESLKDPYSTFLSKEQLTQLYGSLEAKLVGIGAGLSQKEGKLMIEFIVPDSPAMAAHLKVGDEILGINGQPIPASLEKSTMAIRGPSGTEVVLKIRRGTDELNVTLMRREVRLSPVRGLYWNEQGQQYWLDANQKLAYIQLTEFSKLASEDLKSALQKLREQGCKGLVLDLRTNPGGMLQICVEVAQLFLKNAVVVETRGKNPMENQTYRTSDKVEYPELPLVLVVDRQTASAAEILTAALKDNQRAIVVGERTFGKGSVQSILPLPRGTGIKLTTAQMFSPSGATLHHDAGAKQWGVDPTDGYFVPMSKDQRVTRMQKQADRYSGKLTVPQPLTAEVISKDLGDPALAAALQSLEAKVKSGEFTASGRPIAELHGQLAQQDELRKQRDEFRKKLDQLNAELGEN